MRVVQNEILIMWYMIITTRWNYIIYHLLDALSPFFATVYSLLIYRERSKSCWGFQSWVSTSDNWGWKGTWRETRGMHALQPVIIVFVYILSSVIVIYKLSWSCQSSAVLIENLSLIFALLEAVTGPTYKRNHCESHVYSVDP